MNAAPHFKKIALIGFGLIGGSIARAARAIEPPIRPKPISAMRLKCGSVLNSWLTLLGSLGR